MKKVNKAVIIISKIFEIGHFIGAGLATAIFIGLMTGGKDLMTKLSSASGTESMLEGYGFSVQAANGAPLTIGGCAVFFFTLTVVFIIMAMIFRNIYLVFKTSAGETKFSTGETPFQPANVRMVREIGIFAIAFPVFELIMSMAAKIFVPSLETSADISMVVFGLVVLALSQFFAYGVELQEDTDGLV